MSGYDKWIEKEHAEERLIFPENIGSNLSLDETSLTNGELYTILTNKSGKGKKGTLVAIVEGTQSDKIIEAFKKIPLNEREKVKEVTLDMAGCMQKIVKGCFPNATRVIDRFHVQKLAYDALQEIRIKHRWDAINEETNAIENAKSDGIRYVPVYLDNGDTKKQLLARSRYLLFKSGDKWTDRQKQRAKVLFELYPDIKQAYSLTHSLRMIFSKTKVKGSGIYKDGQVVQ